MPSPRIPLTSCETPPSTETRQTFWGLTDVHVEDGPSVWGTSRRPQVAAGQINRMDSVEIDSSQHRRTWLVREEFYKATARRQPAGIVDICERNSLAAIEIHAPQFVITTHGQKFPVCIAGYVEQWWSAGGNSMSLQQVPGRNYPNACQVVSHIVSGGS
jgi:hypothetical protein